MAAEHLLRLALLRSMDDLGCTLVESQQAPVAHCVLLAGTRAAFAAAGTGARQLMTRALDDAAAAALTERVRELDERHGASHLQTESTTSCASTTGSSSRGSS
jgi:hypothetical protein